MINIIPSSLCAYLFSRKSHHNHYRQFRQNVSHLNVNPSNRQNPRRQQSDHQSPQCRLTQIISHLSVDHSDHQSPSCQSLKSPVTSVSIIQITSHLSANHSDLSSVISVSITQIMSSQCHPLKISSVTQITKVIAALLRPPKSFQCQSLTPAMLPRRQSLRSSQHQ